MSEAQALGRALAEAPVARELHPGAAPHDHAHNLSACQNCGARLAGRYCHDCGQSGHVHRTLGHVLEEFVHGVLHVDGKLWRTMPLLILNPGRLTRDYVGGHRVRYIAPLALYLFMVLFTFLVFGFAPGFKPIASNTAASPADFRELAASIRQDHKAARADPGADPERLEGLATAARLAEAAAARAEKGAPGPGPEFTVEEIGRLAGRSASIDSGDPAIDARIRAILKNPGFFLYKLQQKAYKLAFLLVPMSVPFIWLLFAARRSVTLYDHTVFVLYSMSFMLLLTCAAVITATIGVATEALVPLMLLAVPPVHIFAQLKGAYGLSRSGALWRTGFVLSAGIIVLILYSALLLALGVLE